ncbi:MAG: hypothetical protein ACKVOT_09085 [Polaromonas sp.]
MATTPKKTVPMFCVRIGYQQFLMPMDKGIKLVELMSSAFQCDETYDGARHYEVEDQPEVTLASVKASQVRQKKPAGSTNDRGQRLLGVD